MNINQNKILNEIYNNLQQNKVYGEMITNMRFPYFHIVLYKTTQNNIGWRNYSSSANKNTIESLKWIIETIFKCTPEDFVRTYECKTIEEINKIYD